MVVTSAAVEATYCNPSMVVAKSTDCVPDIIQCL